MRPAGLVALVIATWCCVPLGGCRTAPIHDVAEAPLQIEGTVSLDDVSEGIWRAGRKLGWEVTRIAPGRLEARLRLRSHLAVVDITHDTKHFSIRFREARNLGEGGGRIHAQYNVWVSNLQRQIRREPIRARLPEV